MATDEEFAFGRRECLRLNEKFRAVIDVSNLLVTYDSMGAVVIKAHCEPALAERLLEVIAAWHTAATKPTAK